MYPPDTQLVTYNWADPLAPIEQGPVIEIRVHRTPHTQYPDRLRHELNRALAQVVAELVDATADMDHLPVPEVTQ